MKIDKFISYIRDIRRYSMRTVQSYNNNLLFFKSWLDSQDLKEQELKPRDINNYIAFLMDRGLKPNSVNQYLASIRSYFDYCCRFEDYSCNPAAGVHDVRTPKLLPKFISEDKMNVLIDKLLPKQTFKQYRTRIAILVFYHCGIRCVEMERLTFHDIDIKNRYLRVLGKRNKERIIPFGEELANELQEYKKIMQQEIKSKCDSLLPTIFGTPCDSFQIRIITKQALLRIVPKELAHPHVLRHTFATVLMNHGAKIENVRMLLGHASCDTTAIYQHVSIRYLQNAYNKYFKK